MHSAREGAGAINPRQKISTCAAITRKAEHHAAHISGVLSEIDMNFFWKYRSKILKIIHFFSRRPPLRDANILIRRAFSYF